MKTQLLILDKTPYENGKASSEYFRKHLNPNVLKSTPLSQNPEMKSKCIQILNQLKESYPNYYEEVQGKADGLNMDLLDYFSILCPELFNFGFEHCTSIIAYKENGHVLLSHNEDDNYIPGNFCLSKVYTSEKDWFVTNDMYNMPFGNGISYNNHGIVKSINYTHDENIQTEYLPRYFGQRHISEACSIEDLIQRCKEMKTASGFHVNAIDLNTKEAVSIEVYNEEISVIKIKDYNVHTNHYIHNDYINNQKTDPGSNSIFRLNKASELMKEAERTIPSIKEILRYRGPENAHESTIFQTPEDPYLTLFNFTFDTETPNQIIMDICIYDETITLEYERNT